METAYSTILGLTEYFPSIPIAIFLNFLIALWILRCVEFSSKCNAGLVNQEDIKLAILACSISLGFIAFYLLYVPLGATSDDISFNILMQGHAVFLIIGFLFGLLKIKQQLTMPLCLMLICYASILIHYYLVPERPGIKLVDFSDEFTFFVVLLLSYFSIVLSTYDDLQKKLNSLISIQKSS